MGCEANECKRSSADFSVKCSVCKASIRVCEKHLVNNVKCKACYKSLHASTSGVGSEKKQSEEKKSDEKEKKKGGVLEHAEKERESKAIGEPSAKSSCPDSEKKKSEKKKPEKPLPKNDYPELLILHVDVGQGECTLLVEWIPGDVDSEVCSSMKPIWVGVIDGGYATFGRGALSRYLDALGIKRVDDMFCTHFDGDHTKGLTALFKHHGEVFEFGNLWVRNDKETSFKSSTKLELLKHARKRCEVHAIKEDQRLKIQSDCLSVTCIHSDAKDLQDENEGSIALKIEYGDFVYYTGGDLPIEQEKRILSKCEYVDAFKCGHHGSANSTPVELIDAWRPHLAFISCGVQSFGHPTYDVMERLCAPKSSVEGIYLTNCIHNRRVVNPTYVEGEKELEGQYVSLMEAVEKDKRERLGAMLKKAKERAAEHREKKLNETTRAFVAGSKDHLGTVALRVSAIDGRAHHYVGWMNCFYETGKANWEWTSYGTKKFPKEDKRLLEERLKFLKGKLSTAVTKALEADEYVASPLSMRNKVRVLKDSKKKLDKVVSGPSDETLHTPVKTMATTVGVKGTPVTFPKTISDRTLRYRLFDQVTVVGLHFRDKKPFIAFCMYCRLSEPDERNGHSEEILEIDCEEHGYNDDVSVHEHCYLKWLNKGPVKPKLSMEKAREVLGEYLSSDGDRLEGLPPEYCPFCNHKGDYNE